MANQIKPPTPLATEEFKEINRENYKDYFELSQKEVSRLTAENRELILKSEKQNKKLEKKKVELETEKTNSVTLRQFIQELSNKVQLLERAAPPSVSPTIPLAHTPILNSVLSEEFVEKLVIEKSGLESQVCEQKREIEFLNSELISNMNKLAHFTESQNPAFAPNNELTQLRADLASKEQQLVQSKSNYSSVETECKLGKQLFQDALASLSADKELLQQHLDVERAVNGKLGLEIEQHMKLVGAQRTSLLEQVEKMDSFTLNEEMLQTQIHELQTETMQLKNNESSVLTGVEEQTQQLKKDKEKTKTLINNIRYLEEKESELNELKATFAIMSKETNRLTVENVEMRTKQLACEMEIEDLHEAIKEYQIRNQELSSELSELKHSNSVVKEGQFDSLVRENKQLCLELTEFKEKLLQTIENNNKQHFSELQKKEISIANLENELETIKTDFEKERDEILKGKELEISNLKQEIERTETELRGEVEQQREELEYLQGQSSRNEENANIIEDLTSEKSSLEQTIESLKEENKKLTLKLIENAENLKLTAELDNANDQILKLKQSNLSNEDHLRRKINGLANENMELNNNINTLRFKIEEQNNQIIASKQSQRETDKTQTQLETKDKQISNLKMQIMDQQATEQTNQNQVEKQLKELNDEIEQLQRDNVDLENVIKSEQNTEKCFALDSDKRVLEDQIDLLHGQIETLALSQQEDKQKIEDLEGSYENLTNQSKDLEIQLGESKSDFKRLQTEREETSQHSQQLIDELKTELEAARNERDRERDNSVISKQLITKLNSDIKNLEQNDSGQRIAELERQLAETEKAWTDTDLKLGDMAAEIAHRDTRIHTLRQDIGIYQNKAQVTKSTSTPSMPANTSKIKEDKKSPKVSKDRTKQKHPDTSGATPGATISDLTPQIVPVANKSGRAPLKFLLRPGIPVSAVKLKAFPNPIEYQGNQVICIVNKRYELGIFMVLFEIQTRLNMRNVTVKYVGIILDSPVGNCNGEFRTKRYFECEPNCGIFVPFEDVLVPVV